MSKMATSRSCSMPEDARLMEALSSVMAVSRALGLASLIGGSNISTSMSIFRRTQTHGDRARVRAQNLRARQGHCRAGELPQRCRVGGQGRGALHEVPNAEPGGEGGAACGW